MRKNDGNNKGGSEAQIYPYPSAIFKEGKLFTKFLINNHLILFSQSGDNIIHAEKAFLCKNVFFTYVRRYENGEIRKEELLRILSILEKYKNGEVEILWNVKQKEVQVKRVF